VVRHQKKAADTEQQRKARKALSFDQRFLSRHKKNPFPSALRKTNTAFPTGNIVSRRRKDFNLFFSARAFFPVFRTAPRKRRGGTGATGPKRQKRSATQRVTVL
jgi:hypothetical protein